LKVVADVHVAVRGARCVVRGLRPRDDAEGAKGLTTPGPEALNTAGTGRAEYSRYQTR
jgi:hypothetical protein